MVSIGLVCALAVLRGVAVGGTESVRLDGGWSFRHEADSGWRAVTIPHDWSIEHAPRQGAPSEGHGGFYPCGKGEYKLTLKLSDEELKKVLSLYFEGVYRDATVKVNGKFAGKGTFYGYVWFRVGLNGLVKSGENEIVVTADNSAQPNCRWYSGSGMFRSVWLEKRDAEHVVPGSVHVRTVSLSAGSAKVVISGVVTNATTGAAREERKELALANPVPWTPETPKLYEADFFGERISYGVRTVAWNVRDGFLLNGKSIKLHGACVHHDHGPLGAASHDAAELRKVLQLKRAGFNAVRTSHAPVSEAFLSACDREGLLVIAETFDGWRIAKCRHDYSKRFVQDWERDLTATVRRDRNHPSVVMLSIGNELWGERDPHWNAVQAERMVRLCHALAPELPVTMALCGNDAMWRSHVERAGKLDIVGCNYKSNSSVENDHRNFPNRLIVHTETYPVDAVKVWRNIRDNAYVFGEFVWTGIDYLGEAAIGRFAYNGVTECGGHGNGLRYPWHGSYCGDIDITGWRKPISHLRETLWNETAPTYLSVREPDGWRGKLTVSPWTPPIAWESWSFYGWEGKTVVADVCTRKPKVRLVLNGKAVGEREVSEATGWAASFEVKFEPGELRAEALDASGKVVETSVLRSAGAPASIRRTRERIGDLEWVVAEVVDGKGTVCPDAAVDVVFDGDVIATCSADPCDLVPAPSRVRKTWHGRAMAVIRPKRAGSGR